MASPEPAWTKGLGTQPEPPEPSGKDVPEARMTVLKLELTHGLTKAGEEVGSACREAGRRARAKRHSSCRMSGLESKAACTGLESTTKASWHSVNLGQVQ